MNPITDKFEKIITGRFCVRRGSGILIACSGGSDSVALFYLLLHIKERLRLRLGLAYLDHGLRKAARKEADFVKKLGKKNGIPVFIGAGKVLARVQSEKESLEEAARHERIRFLVDTAKKRKFSRVALAHTQNDQAETVLMRLFQGTGLKGLSGIREQWKKDGILLIRPLLEWTKEDLQQVLKTKRASYCRDKSNQSKRFVRNRIRLEILPKIAELINPKIIATLARLPKIVNEENALLADVKKSAWKKAFRRKQTGKVYLEREVFLKMPAPLQFRILDKALKIIDPKSGMAFESWEYLRERLKRPRYRRSLPRRIDFDLSPSEIKIYRVQPKRFGARRVR